MSLPPTPAAPDPQLLELDSICIAAAESGARVLRELFDRPREVRLKGRIDLVTDADRAAEERILLLLRERAPGVAILAEESGAHGDGAARARFIVDPLDGTTNYAHGIPLFACTVAVEQKGVVVAGCTVDPLRGERFTPCAAEAPGSAGRAWIAPGAAPRASLPNGGSPSRRPPSSAMRSSAPASRTTSGRGSPSRSPRSGSSPSSRAGPAGSARPRWTWPIWRRGASTSSTSRA